MPPNPKTQPTAHAAAAILDLSERLVGLHSERHIETDYDSLPHGPRACEHFKQQLREAAANLRKSSSRASVDWERALPLALGAAPARPAPGPHLPRPIWLVKLSPEGSPKMVVVFAVDAGRNRVYVLHAYPERLLTTTADRQVAHDRAAERLNDYYPRREPKRNP